MSRTPGPRSPHVHAATRRLPTVTLNRRASRSQAAMRSLIARRGGEQKIRAAHRAARSGEARCMAPNAARVSRRVAVIGLPLTRVPWLQVSRCGVFALVGERPGETGELLLLRGAERLREPAGRRGNLGVDPRQQLQAGTRDGGQGAPPVFVVARAAHESLPHEAVDHARDVGRAMNAAAGNLSPRAASRMRLPQRTEDPVLVAGDSMAFADLPKRLLYVTGRAHHADGRRFRGRKGSLFHTAPNSHTATSVPNTHCQVSPLL